MTAPASDERHLEIKVGAMILVALCLLVAFILILGDWSLASKREMDVYFQNPGGLAPGAPVKVAGRKAGSIIEMTYLGQSGPQNPLFKAPALVRARVKIDEKIFDHLRADVRFYITTKGVLGDPYLEIEPGVSPQKLMPDKPIFGIDPPRLDLFVADAYRLVRGLTDLLERNADNLDKLVASSAHLLGTVDVMVGDPDGGQEGTKRIDRMLTSAEGLLDDTRALVKGTHKRYIDDPKIASAISHMESLSRQLDAEVGPLMTDVKEALAIIDRLGDTIGPKEQAALKEALAHLGALAKKADKTITDVGVIVDKVKRGEGTAGQILSDEQLYDDLKEFIRDLKRNPWKLIWQE